MIHNFLKIAFRNILKHKSFSFINIIGLAIGIACTILIILYVNFERGFDRYHENADNIYRICIRASIGNTPINQTYSSAENLKRFSEEIPEIIYGVKFLNIDEIPIIYENETRNETGFVAADSTFFKVFTMPLINGDPDKALVEPNTMVVTATTAMKYFGSLDVVGKTLTPALWGEYGPTEFTITGVAEDMPSQSHFHFNFLVSNTTFPEYINNRGWTNNNFITYLLLNNEATQVQVEEKLNEFVESFGSQENYEAWKNQGNYWEYFLQPLTEIHLTSDLNGEWEPNGNKTYVYVFSVIAVIILLIACINFMNLTTAKSSLRIREIGLRKVVGSTRRKLILQFITESIILSLIALVIGIILIELLLPVYRNFVARPLSIPYFSNPLVIPGLLLLAIVVGTISGSYPAAILSSYKPALIIKGQPVKGKGGFWLRNALVVLQFTISIFLIVSTLIVYQQMRFLQNTSLGFNKEQVVVVRNPGYLGDKYDSFKEELQKQNYIVNVAGSNALPGTGFSNIGFGAEEVEQGFSLNLCVCDYDFLETLEIELVAGRFFSKDFPSDSSAAVLNETAIELMGWDDPIGKRINNWNNENRGNFHIIGVIKDYHYESLHSDVRAQALFLNSGYYQRDPSYISIRLNTGDLTQAIKKIEEIWYRFVQNRPFEYSFLDEDYANLYDNEWRTRKLISIFAILAIFIACLGLYGLSSFIADQKIKEIGIRKTMGATVASVVNMLNRRFALWVLGANIIAWPLAWYVMKKWLQNFAYRIDISVALFIIAALMALIIAIAITSIQTIRAARSNPADSLRQE